MRGNQQVNTAQAAAQANFAARNAVLTYGVPRFQPLQTVVVSAADIAAGANQVSIVPRNVGLIRGFLVKVTATLLNGDVADAATRAPFGAANLLSNIQFTDMNQLVRVNCSGRSLNLINSAKEKLAFGGAYSPNVPVGYGNNWDVMVGPASIASGGAATQEVQMYFYVPLAYSKLDLRGAMWAGVVNSTSQLQLTINPTPMVDAGDRLNAVYYGSGSSGYNTGSNVTIEVWQDYIDQVPYNGGQPVLPQGDLSLAYQILDTSMNGLTSGQDFGVPFANFRNFLSTTIIVDNGVTPFLNNGDELNYFKLSAANSSTLWQYDPETAAFLARNQFAADPPLGAYHFSMRDRPINTQQFGNMEILVNPNSNINAAAYLAINWEFFAALNQVTFASSLPNGG